MFFIVFDLFSASAQTTVTIGGGGVATNGPFDIADANYVGSGEIYLNTEIAARGIITALEWDNFSCPPSITIPVKIYLKLVPTTTTTWPTETYATAISGATLVYSGNATFNNNGFANAITLTTPFAYNSATNNLEIITEADNGTTNQNEPSWYYNTNLATGDCSWYSASQSGLAAASNSTGGIDQYRPSVKLFMDTNCSTPTITFGVNGSNASVCSSSGAQNANLAYTATTNGPTTYSISGWSGGGFATVSNATLNAGSISIAVPAAEAAGSYTATLTVTNACGVVSSNYNIGVTVNAAPVATASNNSVICAGQALTLTGGPASMTTYAWAGPSGYTNSGQSPTVSNTATTAMAGTYTITVTDGNNCTASASTSATVNSAPATPANISGPASVCALATNVYSVTSVNGATSYTWTLPTGWSGTSTTNSISATQGTGGGTISVTANNTCGNSIAQTLAVTLTATPAIPGAISGPDSVCANSTNIFSVTAVNGATSYTWTLPTGWSGTSTTASIQAIQGTGPGTITVTANNVCASSTAQTLAVTIASPPGSLGSITGADSGCANSQHTYSVSPVSNATSYIWSLPNGWTGTSTTNSIVATLGTTGGNVSVTANNACSSTAAQMLMVNIIAIPATPATIIGPVTVCGSGTNIYSVAPVSGATSYTWALSGSWTGSSSTDSISVTSPGNGGTVSVTANGTCGSSAVQILTITSSSPPAMPGNIAQSGTVCSGGQDTFSISAVSRATSYTWTLPSGWSGSSTTLSIDATAGANSGTVSVTANNACGSSMAQTLSVSPGSTPAMPGSIMQSGTGCIGDADTFSVGAINGATSYTWTLPNGWTGSSTTLSINTAAGAGSGTVSVTANNACGSSAAQNLTVNPGSTPAAPGSISGSDSVCAGSPSNGYSIVTVNGATSYTWTLPGGWSGSSTSETISAGAGTAGGNISVTANNTCGSSAAQNLNVVVNAAPQVLFSFAQNPVCNNENPVVNLTGGTPGGGTYSGQGVTGTTFDASSLSAGNYVLTYTVTNAQGCPGSDTATAIVTVCVGIETISDEQISVYPNPFNDAITIKTRSNTDKGTVTLTDAIGREAIRTEFEAGLTEIQLGTRGLAKGAYLLEIIVEGKPIAAKKLMRIE